MNITKRTALQAAAWTAVGIVALGAVGELANARTTVSPASLAAQATGPTGAGDDEAKADKPERRRGPKGKRAPGHKAFGMKGRVLHGEATVKGKDDVVRVIVTQTGAITAASATSITVRSDDGFTSTWALTPATKVHKGREAATAADLKVGDIAHVMGEKTAAGVVTKHVGVRPTEEERAAAKAKREADTPA